MRIAYLSESKIPSREANSIHVMKMCEAFARLGHDVTLVAPLTGEDFEADVADPFVYYGVDPCFAVKRLARWGFRGGKSIYGWHAGRLARYLGADRAVGRCLYSCAVAARMGVPTIWDAHMGTFLKRWYQRPVFEWMINAPSFLGVTTNCDALRREILTQVPALEGRVRAAHNGADPLPVDIKPATLGTQNGRLSVGYSGHLYAGKGFELIREIAEKAPFADFHVVGGDQATVDALRRDPSLAPNIRLHGFVSPSEVARLNLACDVLLAPYQREVRTAGGGETGAWMSPLKVFGYMAAGKPILCSDLPVLKEIIEGEKNGILLPHDDASAWAAALRRLAEDPGQRDRLGTRARADFLMRHTWRQRAIRVLDTGSIAV